jgi:hypothetical protein
MALIARPFTIPAVNGNGTLYVEDVPGLADTAVVCWRTIGCC